MRSGCPDTWHLSSERGSNHVTGDPARAGIRAQANLPGGNYPYVGGHVEFMRTSQVMQGWVNY